MSGPLGMDFVEIIPLEILEEIFLYLAPEDLIRCCRVSHQWREIVNSNKIWSKKCVLYRIHNKEPLDPTKTFFRNPSKMYRLQEDYSSMVSCSRLSPICYWRSHYYKFMQLERNWRKGNFGMKRSSLNVESYQDGYIINRNREGLDVYSINDLSKPMKIRRPVANVAIMSVVVKDRYLFFTQMGVVLAYERTEKGFEKVNEFNVDMGVPKDNGPWVPPNIIALKITDKFLLVHTKGLEPKKLLFFDYKGDKGVLRAIDLNSIVGKHYQFLNEIDPFDDKVYIRYARHGKHYISVYDFPSDKCLFDIESHYKPFHLTCSKNFFVAGLPDSQDEGSCELHVWSSHTGAEVALFSASKSLPFIVTDDDRIIYSDHDTIFIRGLITPFHRELYLTQPFDSMYTAWPNFLLVKFTCSLELWDINAGIKIGTILRSFISELNVDDKYLLVRKVDHNLIINFW